MFKPLDITLYSIWTYLKHSLHCEKIGTRSVHVGSLCEVSQDTPNYNCTSLRIMTMSNTHDRNFAVYGQTQANCNVFFL